jgi:hypothetical protein
LNATKTSVVQRGHTNCSKSKDEVWIEKRDMGVVMLSLEIGR